jgi:peptide/nickel transport system permease protein
MTSIATVDSEKTVAAIGGRRGAHVWHVLSRDPLAIISISIIVIFLLVATFAPVLAPYPEQGAGKSSPDTLFLPPSSEHLFGTDELGRDVFSRVMYGARPAFLIPLMVVASAVVIGASLGAIAGYKGGWVDELIMRVTDLFLAFPSLLLAMAITAALGRGLQNAAIALIISWWPWYTRLVRGIAVSLRERSYVEAAKVIGVRDSIIIVRHILPNSISAILVQVTVDMGTVILVAGGLAFIGLGTQPPAADWGLMISSGRTSVLNQGWISLFPALAIFVLILAFNLLGDVLRDIFDPRQYQ